MPRRPTARHERMAATLIGGIAEAVAHRRIDHDDGLVDIRKVLRGQQVAPDRAVAVLSDAASSYLTPDLRAELVRVFLAEAGADIDLAYSFRAELERRPWFGCSDTT
jgi:hypothetical protein